MRYTSSLLPLRVAVALMALAGATIIAPQNVASSAFPVHFEKELLSLPSGQQYDDSRVIDVNGDGKMDLVALNDGELYVMLGDGTGHFAAPKGYNKGGFQSALAFGDFNGDGFPDAVVVNFSVIDLLLNNGAGGFPTPVPITLGPGPSGLAVADFNLDGKLDVAVSDNKSNSIYILLGNGSGGFASPIVFPTGTYPSDLAVGDFDHDGVPDLAAVEYGSMDLRIFKGAGDGTFAMTATYPLGVAATQVVRADFNHDGNIDLVVAFSGATAGIDIFLGDGTGGFTQSSSVQSHIYKGLAVADFDGNKTPDLAFINAPGGPEQVAVALGNGDGTFGTPRYISLAHAGTGADYSISAGDVNGDGRIDIFSPEGSGVVLLNKP